MAQVVPPVATLACSPKFEAHSVSTRCCAYCQVGQRDLTYRPLYPGGVFRGESEGVRICPHSLRLSSCGSHVLKHPPPEVSSGLTKKRQILMRLERGQCQVEQV